VKRLGREAVAANSATHISYDLQVCVVIDMVGSAFAGNNEEIKELADQLNVLNTQSLICPY